MFDVRRIDVDEIAKELEVGDVVGVIERNIEDDTIDTYHYLISRKVIPVSDHHYEYSPNYVIVNLSTACVTEIESPSIKGLIEQLAEPFMDYVVDSIYLSKFKHVACVKEQ